MAPLSRFFAIAALLVATGGGCDRRGAQTPQPAPPATAPGSLDNRLLRDLDSRRQWPTNAVKVWLKNPTIALDIKPADGKPLRLHAWARNENDYHTAMMRLDGGDVLYALTDAEFEELCARAAAATVP